MEQANRTRAHIERLLFVCGDRNAGKSRLIREMFSDRRLGGTVPTAGRLPIKPLSRERCIAGRIMSPHEAMEAPADFHSKIDDACEAARGLNFWRINYVSAVQPRAANRMPGIVDICRGVQDAFLPERIRVAVLDPDQAGTSNSHLSKAEVDGLRTLDVEVIMIDARRSGHRAEPGNVRILADFFDFS
ncbi:hypothetical protein V5F79_23630 [Xanthobacter flavus]|uniref:hypothetical protein n=1 Tax=Xanthobacter flavus TaxID=281 RepID=UPI00372979F6